MFPIVSQWLSRNSLHVLLSEGLWPTAFVTFMGIMQCCVACKLY